MEIDEAEHRCYSCGKDAEFEIESVGPSHRMVIWVCSDHHRGERILTKIVNGTELHRVERVVVTWEPVEDQRECGHRQSALLRGKPCRACAQLAASNQEIS